MPRKKDVKQHDCIYVGKNSLILVEGKNRTFVRPGEHVKIRNPDRVTVRGRKAFELVEDRKKKK